MSNVDELKQSDLKDWLANRGYSDAEVDDFWVMMDQFGLCLMPVEATSDMRTHMLQSEPATKGGLYLAAVETFQSQLNGDTNG